MLHVDDDLGGRRTVILGALFDPLLDEIHLVVGQGILAARHGGALAVLGNDLRDKIALVGPAGNDTGTVALSLLEQVGMAGHDVAALGLGGLMAALAVLLEDRADVLVIADLVGDLGILLVVAVQSG